ncbi:glycoside hydrolase family 3 protein [Athelia psychrophila]|uniref:beta-glucosidase n=1 Tax=Athelia psychrophila TaxID=1759441 RepID=A0A166DIH0_9AGAM|nr:glycoside hydrolase family 3 protein [Fibularhizoctonia sp. CBS 109695]
MKSPLSISLLPWLLLATSVAANTNITASEPKSSKADSSSASAPTSSSASATTAAFSSTSSATSGSAAEYASSISAFATSVAATSAVSATGTASAAVGTPTPPASNATLTPSKPVNGDGGWSSAVSRARAFVAQLTIPEKVNLTTGVDLNGRCVGNTGSVPRLNFAGFCLQDSPVGLRDADYVSLFPAGMNVAMTWDAGLMYARGAAMGSEFRGKGVNVALGPMMNLARNAAAGRNWEGAGADPFLTGVHAANNILGIQSKGVIACAKHFALNEQEHYRGGNGAEAYSSNQDDRSFHEMQLWPFAESVRAGVGSVMCAYNRVNGTQACENRHLMNAVLKEELDFQGFMVSDWAAVTSLYASVMNGADMNQPGFVAYSDPDDPNPALANNTYWGPQLGAAVEAGTIPASRFDDMVVRIMAAYYKMGQDRGFPAVNFDYNTKDTYYNGEKVNEHVNVMGNHSILIREIGAASTVLLKNLNSTLPIDFSKVKNLAILGSDAGPNIGGPNSCVDRGCNQGTLAIGWGSGTADFPYLVDPLAAIQMHVRAANPVGVVQAVLDDYDYAAVAATASQADTCLVFVNADSGEGYITVDGNAGDRNNLTLWHAGDALVLATAAQCANTVVVMHIVGPVLVEAWFDHPNVTAILNAGIPGQETGNSILDVLSGAVNPSARLPFTMAKQRSDYASDVLYNVSNSSVAYIPEIDYTEKLELDYKWFDAKNITPRYEFGYGLSYTTFAYSGLSLTKAFASAAAVSRSSGTQPGGESGLYNHALNASFSVKNTGKYDGNEVAQVYIGFPEAAGEPPRVLRGFERSFIKKGQSAQFSVGLRVKDLSIWDVITQSWVIPTGEFKVYVGSSSRELHLTKTFTL